MKNLAGVQACDTFIKDELERAGIEVICVKLAKSNTEVPYRLIGKLGDITFHRAWYYWMVKCKVPLKIAQELYSHPEGKKTVRVTGDCTCPPPDNNVVWISKKSGRPLMLQSKVDQYKDDSDILRIISEKYDIVDSYEEHGEPFITSYHIDDQAGLLLFAMKMQEYFKEKETL